MHILKDPWPAIIGFSPAYVGSLEYFFYQNPVFEYIPLVFFSTKVMHENYNVRCVFVQTLDNLS